MILALFMQTADGFAQKPEKMMKAVEAYIYGVVFDLKDSVVYFTEVKPLENAWYNKANNFLYARSEYSIQLRDYATKIGVKDPTAFVSFEYKRNKIEKKYLRMRTKMQKDGYLIKYISAPDFVFRTIEYVALEAENQ